MRLGVGLYMLHDLDGDGINEIVAGSQDGYKGYLYVMCLDTNGQVKSYTTINPDSCGIDNDNFHEFGQTVADFGDLDKDGHSDVIVGFLGDSTLTGRRLDFIFKQ